MHIFSRAEIISEIAAILVLKLYLFRYIMLKVHENKSTLIKVRT